MNRPVCPACATPSTGRFCANCGRAVGTPAGPDAALEGRERRAWRIAAGAAVVVLVILGVTVLRERSGAAATEPAATAPAAPEGTPPDLSSMTPRERFDRLYKRVMGAAESGDTVTVTRFAPMVFAAYQQLDTVDADARYHAAVLELHVKGDTAAALRLADTVLASNPHHLFGFLIQGMAAQLSGDQRLLARARAGFLGAWDEEMKAGRPEYRDHQAMLEQFRGAAAPVRGVKGP